MKIRQLSTSLDLFSAVSKLILEVGWKRLLFNESLEIRKADALIGKLFSKGRLMNKGLNVNLKSEWYFDADATRVSSIQSVETNPRFFKKLKNLLKNLLKFGRNYAN